MGTYEPMRVGMRGWGRRVGKEGGEGGWVQGGE